MLSDKTAEITFANNTGATWLIGTSNVTEDVVTKLDRKSLIKKLYL